MNSTEVPMSTTEGTPATESVEQFLGTVSIEFGAAASAAMAVLGDRLGLYRAMAAGGA